MSKLGPAFWVIAACAVIALLLQIQWLVFAMVVLAVLLLLWEGMAPPAHEEHHADETAKQPTQPAASGGGFMDVFIGTLMADKHRELNKPKEEKNGKKEGESGH